MPADTGEANELAALRAQYEKAFGKRARGRYGSDVAWLRKKLGAVAAVKETSVPGAAEPGPAPAPAAARSRSQTCSLTKVGGHSPRRGAGKVRRARGRSKGADHQSTMKTKSAPEEAPEPILEVAPESEQEPAKQTPKSRGAETRAAAGASNKNDDSSATNDGRASRTSAPDTPTPADRRKGTGASPSQPSSSTTSSRNVYARLAAGASSWLLADSKSTTIKPSQAQNAARAFTNSSSSVIDNVRQHAFGSSAQRSSASMGASSFLDFNATSVTKGGRRINVAKITAGPKCPGKRPAGSPNFRMSLEVRPRPKRRRSQRTTSGGSYLSRT